jgi:hypothetical protein
VKFLGKNGLLLFVFMFTVAIAGCTAKQNDPTEKVYTILENVVAKEQVFEKQQEPLVALEKKEKGLYAQILKLGMKEYDQIAQLADEALASADKRKELIEKETASLKESEIEFQKVANVKKDFKNPDLEKLVEDLFQIMVNRYRAHDELYKQYTEGIQYDKELYSMFKNKDIHLEDLENQVKKVNESYKKVNEENQKFNQYTEEYNDKKLSFYKKAGLNAAK